MRSMRDTEGVALALDGREFDEGIVNGIELEGYRGGRELDKLVRGGTLVNTVVGLDKSERYVGAEGHEERGHWTGESWMRT